MRVIALVNQKGGVGKTTTTKNLGAGLVREGKKVLLIDLDPQANLTYSLGIRPENDETMRTMYEVLKGTTNLKDIILTHANGVHLAPAHINLSASELELTSQAGRELILKEAIRPVLHDYDYILIDCAPSLGILTLNALVASREVFIPLQTEFLAMQGMSKLLETLDVVKQRLNHDIEVTAIIGTMYDGRKNLAGEIVASVRTHFGDRLLKTLVRSNVSLAEAPSYGQDIFTYKPDSIGAEDYQALAKEVIAMEGN
jgi:chromosome partitioning protein